MADPVKSGVKTSEFWGKCLIQLALILEAVFKIGIDLNLETAMIIAGGLEAIYQVVRGTIKVKASGSKSLVWLLLPLMAFSSGCAWLGIGAREYTLAPAMSLAWTSIKAEIQLGAETASDEEQSKIARDLEAMNQAMEKKDPAAISAAPWEYLRLWAMKGISVKKEKENLSAGVVQSLEERVNQFTRGWTRMRK